MQILMDAAATASVYALVALGFAMTHRPGRAIHLAHGSSAMLGAWIGAILAARAGWTAGIPAWGALALLPAGMVPAAALGLAADRLYRLLGPDPGARGWLVAAALALFVQHVAALPWLFGAHAGWLPRLLPDPLLVGLALALLAGADALVHFTGPGRSLRSASPSEAASALAFAVGPALAASAGLLSASRQLDLAPPTASAWLLLGLAGLLGAVLGGIDDPRRAAAGGALVGLIQSVVSAVAGPAAGLAALLVLAATVALRLPASVAPAEAP